MSMTMLPVLQGAEFWSDKTKELAEPDKNASPSLAITAEQIRTSKNNRLILDDIYTSLLNDINPGAIDERTQDRLDDRDSR